MKAMMFFRFLLPRVEYALLIAVFWGILASGPRILNFDGDLPRHILTGELILQTGQIHTTDLFSFRTTGYASYPHEWLSQVLFAAAYRHLNLDGIMLTTALLIVLTWSVVFRLTAERTMSLLLSLAITALGVGASLIHILPRPHIITYLLTAVWIRMLENISERNTRSWWLLPIVMLLWVNLHGMFVLGILILGIYLLGDFLSTPSIAWFMRRNTTLLFLGGALSILATFVSPSGPDIWKAITSLGSNAYITSIIPEYQSPNFHHPETWPFLLLLLLTMIGFARSTTRPSWKDILLVSAFTGLALYSSRMIPVFAIIVVPIAAAVITSWMQNEYGTSRLWRVEDKLNRINNNANGLIWFYAIGLVAFLLLRSGNPIDPEGRGNKFDGRFFPVEAASWLETHPQGGRMFNEFDWGGYILLRLWPEYQIFMDGHTHIYGEALTREYQQIINLGAGWEKILNDYDVDWIIMRKYAPLVRELSRLEEWEIAYEDATTIILVRR